MGVHACVPVVQDPECKGSMKESAMTLREKRGP